MAKFTFSIETDDGGEMAMLVEKLFPAGGVPETRATEDVNTGEPKRRGRPPKDTAAPVISDAGATSLGDPTPADPKAGSGQTAANVSPSEPVTLEMIKAAGTVVLEKKDMSTLQKILEPYGAKRFANVKPGDMSAVHAALVAAVA